MMAWSQLIFRVYLMWSSLGLAAKMVRRSWGMRPVWITPATYLHCHMGFPELLRLAASP